MKHKNLMPEVGEMLDAGAGWKAIASRFGVGRSTARQWVYAYRIFGKEALLNGKKRSYSQSEKLEAVRLYLDDGLSKFQIMERLGIKSLSALERWIREFRAGGEDALAPKPRGRKPKDSPAYATREEELEARIRELELEVEILKRFDALIDEIEQRRHRR